MDAWQFGPDGVYDFRSWCMVATATNREDHYFWLHQAAQELGKADCVFSWYASVVRKNQHLRAYVQGFST